MLMQERGPFEEFGQEFAGYLPTLAAGFIVLLVGVIVGWLAKRTLVRVLFLLRLDRLAGGQSPWRAAIGKGDVRDAVYGALGTAAGVVVLLVFLENSLQIWGLTVLSRMVDRILVYLPTMALAAVIAGLGWTLSTVIARNVEEMLEREDVPRPRLIAGLVKAAFLSVVGALALWELNFAREIVLAAFLIGFGAVGVAFALAVGIGTAKAIQSGWSLLLERRKSGD